MSEIEINIPFFVDCTGGLSHAQTTELARQTAKIVQETYPDCVVDYEVHQHFNGSAVSVTWCAAAGDIAEETKLIAEQCWEAYFLTN